MRIISGLFVLAIARAIAYGSDARSAFVDQMFRSGVDAVYVNATVTDAGGRLISDLAREEFAVYEDGVEQPVVQFTGERVPVSLGLLLDASDSMLGQPMQDARVAVDRFLGELLDPGDEAFVVAFSHVPWLLALWASPPRDVISQMDHVRPGGGTAIYDALVRAAPLFERRRHQRAAAVVISDGADTASDRSLSDVRLVFRRSDAFVYAIAIDVPGKRRSTRVRPEALREITDSSGGYTEVIHGTAELADATSRIAHELNHQYTLGYTATRGPDGGYRSIRVRVKTPGYFVRARRGYVATLRKPWAKE